MAEPSRDDRENGSGPDSPTDSGSESGRTIGHTPRAVRHAAFVVTVEAVALLGLVGYFVVELIVSSPSDWAAALGVVGFELAGVAALLFIARGLRGVRRWARGPCVAMQVLMLPIGYSLTVDSGRPLWGLPVLALAGTVLYLLATPEARNAYAPDDQT